MGTGPAHAIPAPPAPVFPFLGHHTQVQQRGNIPGSPSCAFGAAGGAGEPESKPKCSTGGACSRIASPHSSPAPQTAIRAHPQPPNLKYGRVSAGSAQRGKEKQRLRVKTHPVPLEFFVFLFFFPICLSEPG